MKKVLLKSIFCLGIAFSSNFGICAITIENFSLNLEKYKGNLDIAQKKIYVLSLYNASCRDNKPIDLNNEY